MTSASHALVRFFDSSRPKASPALFGSCSLLPGPAHPMTARGRGLGIPYRRICPAPDRHMGIAGVWLDLTLVG